MKLYTEEQVNLAIRLVHTTNQSYMEVLESLTPIELPSDEEIEKYIEKTFYGEKKNYFKAGVEFMKEQILNQNK